MSERDNPVALQTAAPAPVPANSTPSAELRDRVKKLRIGGSGGKGGGGRVAWLPWLLCAALALAWGGYAIRDYNQKGVDKEAGKSTKPTTTADDSIKLEVKGYLVTPRKINVSPIQVGGRVLELRGPVREADGALIGGVFPVAPIHPFTEGAMYHKGDVIAVLDAASYQAQVDEAQASLDAAEFDLESAKQRRDAQDPKSVRKVEVDQVEAQLKEARATKLRADQELKRQQDLGPAAAIKERQQAEADAVTSSAKVTNLEATLTLLQQGPRKEQLAALEADVRSAEAKVKAARARLVRSQWLLDNCTIKAPVTGSVLTKTAELGNLADPNAFSASSSGGGAICTLADLSDLEADLEIAEKDYSKLKIGQPCRVKADAFPDKVYTGTLDRIMPEANRAKSIVAVRVKVKLPDGEVPGTFLKPEMGAVVTFLSQDDKKK